MVNFSTTAFACIAAMVMIQGTEGGKVIKAVFGKRSMETGAMVHSSQARDLAENLSDCMTKAKEQMSATEVGNAFHFQPTDGTWPELCLKQVKGYNGPDAKFTFKAEKSGKMSWETVIGVPSASNLAEFKSLAKQSAAAKRFAHPGTEAAKASPGAGAGAAAGAGAGAGAGAAGAEGKAGKEAKTGQSKDKTAQKGNAAPKTNAAPKANAPAKVNTAPKANPVAVAA